MYSSFLFSNWKVDSGRSYYCFSFAGRELYYEGRTKHSYHTSECQVCCLNVETSAKPSWVWKRVKSERIENEFQERYARLLFCVCSRIWSFDPHFSHIVSTFCEYSESNRGGEGYGTFGRAEHRGSNWPWFSLCSLLWFNLILPRSVQSDTLWSRWQSAQGSSWHSWKGRLRWVTVTCVRSTRSCNCSIRTNHFSQILYACVDPAKVTLFGQKDDVPAGPPGNRGREGYDPAKVTLFGQKDDKPAGPPGNRGREGYDPSKVTLF